MNARIVDFDDQEGTKMELPIAGRIKVGERTASGGARSLDHFIATSDNKIVVGAFGQAYGDKPTELQIVFLNSDPYQVCRQYLELRAGSKKYAWGDGENFMIWDPAKKANVPIHCGSKDEARGFMQEALAQVQTMGSTTRGWEARLMLRFWLPQVKGVPGEWFFNTGGSKTSVKKIAKIFDLARAGTKGRLHMLPFTLRVTMQKGDTMEPTKYPVVELLPPSAEVIDKVGNLGHQLHASIFGEGGMRVLTEAEILKEARLLEEAQGGQHNAAPVVVEVPDPDPVTEAKMEVYEPEVQATTKDDPDGPSFQKALERMKKTGTLMAANTEWGDNEEHQGSPAYRKAYVLRVVALTGTEEAFNKSLALWGKEFAQDQDVANAVAQRREKTGWAKPKPQK